MAYFFYPFPLHMLHFFDAVYIVGAGSFHFQGFFLCGVFCAWRIDLMTGFEKSEAKNPHAWHSNASFTLTGGVFKESYRNR